MISRLASYLVSGLAVMRSNARILLVGILVFIFPLLFVWVTQSFFDTAYDNIDRAQKFKVGIIGASLSEFVSAEGVDDNEALTELAEDYLTDEDNTDLVDVRIFQETDDGYLIKYATDASLIDTYVTDSDFTRRLRLDFGNDDSALFPLIINSDRVWQHIQKVKYQDSTYFTFTEHNFAYEDSVMQNRRQQSYYGLTAIFIFLIALAYWIHRQDDWQKHSRVLQKKLDDRGVFSNMIAHEFRTPLTAIKGYASFLEESKNLDDEERRFVKNIRSSTERLVLLVNDFLEVARLQAGKIKLDLKPTDISTVVERTLDDLKPIAKEKNLELIFEKPKHKIELNTDANRIIQILTNIITNSLKYTEKGSVTVALDESYKSVSFIIKDTGMGISADDQRKLFSPFTRVGNVDQTNVTGTGLGMWITKQLVEFLGGTIGVESIRGVGTHIVITFKVE